VRIVSWNVNGLRAVCRKGFLESLSALGGDVVALQEIRATEAQVPEELRRLRGWSQHYTPAMRPGYSGVGLLARLPWSALDEGLGHPDFDREGRVHLARFGRLTVVNAYFPNGNGRNRDLSRIPYKLRFYRRLRAALQPRLDAGEALLVLGDFNTAHAEIDLARPRENRETSGFRPEERRAFATWLAAGWVDTFRHFTPGGGHYSWWSQRGGARARNVGWRIDYVLASPGAMRHVSAASIHAWVGGSDHCPVSVDLEAAVLERTPRRHRGPTCASAFRRP
jgi:exodeoxyribonuclease-3